MHTYFYENPPTSFHDMFNSLAEPNRTKLYKLEPVLFKTLDCFRSAFFPKKWNSIEFELKETKSAKSLKRKVGKIYLNSYASFICKKNVYHVDKLNPYYLLHPVIHKHNFNDIYVTLCSNPSTEYPPFPLYL